MCSVEKVGAVSSSSRAVAFGVHREPRRAPTCCGNGLLQFLSGATSVNPMGFILLALTKEGSGVEGQSDSHSDRSRALPPPANCAKLNRQTAEVERPVTSRKQITPTRSNRQKFNSCSDENEPLTRARLSPVGALLAAPGRDTWLTSSDWAHVCGGPFLQFLSGLPPATFAKGSVSPITFLTGSGSQTEIAVTRSKQK